MRVRCVANCEIEIMWLKGQKFNIFAVSTEADKFVKSGHYRKVKLTDHQLRQGETMSVWDCVSNGSIVHPQVIHD